MTTEEKRKRRREAQVRFRASRTPEQAEKIRRVQKAWWKANKAKSAEYRKRDAKARRAKAYGLTVEQLDELIARTDGRCEICGRKFGLDGRFPNSSAIDHCHTTGKVRGVICKDCNIALAQVEKGWNPEDFIDGVTVYLQRASA